MASWYDLVKQTYWHDYFYHYNQLAITSYYSLCIFTINTFAIGTIGTFMLTVTPDLQSALKVAR